MARTTPTVERSSQRQARTAAKAARLEESGAGGRRIGEASAGTRRAQARRDAAQDAAQDAAPRVQSSAARKAINAARAKAARAVAGAGPKSTDARAGMTVQVNTSAAVEGGARFDAHVRGVIARELARFASRLTRVEVHFSDEDGVRRGGNDKRCRIEARPAARQPVAASADAPTTAAALAAAAAKMKRLLATRLAVAKRPR